MSAPFSVTRHVEFHDTDMAGIAHFTSYFRFMEEAEHEFLRHLGLSVFDQSSAPHISWPRVSVGCDFRAPARFEDEVRIAVLVKELGEKSVTYQFDMYCGDRLLAEGYMTSVCCEFTGKERPRSTIIPDWLRAKLEPFRNA